MRLGIAGGLSHRSPDEWAEKLKKVGCGAVVFPLAHNAGDGLIGSYTQAARDHDLVIAEVGAWCNPLHRDPVERAKNIEYIQNQLRLADRIGARCCVNIAGTGGDIWDGGYAENYTAETYRIIIETVRQIIDGVRPGHTYYALEPMPWMIPDSPRCYAQLIEDIGSPRFASHMDAVNMISSPERYFNSGAFAESCFDILGSHIKSCHVKDVRLERHLTFNLKETFCGDGGFDIKRYALAAERCDKDMPFILEHLPDEEAYLKSLKYIQDLLSDTEIEFR